MFTKTVTIHDGKMQKSNLSVISGSATASRTKNGTTTVVSLQNITFTVFVQSLKKVVVEVRHRWRSIAVYSKIITCCTRNNMLHCPTAGWLLQQRRFGVKLQQRQE